VLAPQVLGCLIVGAGVATVLAARHTAIAASSPLTPPGTWRSVWVAAAVVGYAAYATVVYLVVRHRTIRLWLALSVAVVVQLAPLAGPLLLSRDVYVYWSETRTLWVHHANPYRVPPSTFATDPAVELTSPTWRAETEPYGPAWAALGEVPSAVAGNSSAAAEDAYRGFAALAIVVLLGMLAFVARSSRGLVVLGWNPLIALHYAGGGHNDVWMMVALIGALLASGRALGGALWPLSAVVKGAGALLLPLELARTRFRVPRAFWIGLVGSAVAITTASTIAFGTGWATTGVVLAHGTTSLGAVHLLGETGLRHRYCVAICGLVFAAIYLVLLRSAWRHGTRRLAVAAASLVMLTSVCRPWYTIWPVGLAAVEGDLLGLGAAVALTGYALFGDAIP
jgi:alpha-1,6-mannosyltransferase